MPMDESDVQYGITHIDKAMKIVWDLMKVMGDNYGPEVQADYQEFVKAFQKLEDAVDQIAITVGVKQWKCVK